MTPQKSKSRRRRWELVIGALIVLIVTPLYVPEALAFPYRTEAGGLTVYSTAPPAPRLRQIVRRFEALLAASPINQPIARRTRALRSTPTQWS